jgi:hypothetical protein
MLSSDPRNFNPLLVRSVWLKKTCAEFFKLIVQKQLPSVSLVSVLGFAGVSWLTTTAIAPQIAQAYTANVDVSLTRQTREPFQSFLRRAESVARAATQRSFDRDILVTDVAVTVIGQNDGAIVPLLSLRVSRQAWRNRPDPQRWTRYFPDTQMLLGIKDTPPEQPDVPPQAPVNQRPSLSRQQTPLNLVVYQLLIFQARPSNTYLTQALLLNKGAPLNQGAALLAQQTLTFQAQTSGIYLAQGQPLMPLQPREHRHPSRIISKMVAQW